jgi:hypothetical protein
VYSVGVKVRIRSYEWYLANRDADGDIPGIPEGGFYFDRVMAEYCGKFCTVTDAWQEGGFGINTYRLDPGGRFYWHDWMFDAAGTKNIKEVW